MAGPEQRGSGGEPVVLGVVLEHVRNVRNRQKSLYEEEQRLEAMILRAFGGLIGQTIQMNGEAMRYIRKGDPLEDRYSHGFEDEFNGYADTTAATGFRPQTVLAVIDNRILTELEGDDRRPLLYPASISFQPDANGRVVH